MLHKFLSVCEAFTCFCASVQRNVAGGILFFVLFICVHLCVHSETSLTRCLAQYQYLTHFHQTYIYDALWDRDERFTIWGSKVKGQGHAGIKCAGNSTFWPC